MKTQTALLTGQAAFFGLSLLLSGCSGGGGGTAGGAMYIESCTLGCENGDVGTEIGCSLVDISQNAEISLLFSRPVRLSSVNPGSFSIVNLNNGSIPGGVFTIDSGDSRRLVFRPSLTFSGAGNPVFGFDANETYKIELRGLGQDADGPYVTSTTGKSNTTRMKCTVRTSQPLIDPVPGDPTMSAYVTDTLQAGTNAVTYDPVTKLPVGGVTLNGAAGIKTLSRIVLIFDDVMNLATVANQLNGQSNTMTVLIDGDGNLNTTGDQVVQAGDWTVDVDFDDLLRTVAIFVPSGGEFPTGGSDLLNPRKVVVAVTDQLLDIVGKKLENPGIAAFSTLVQPFDEEVIVEDFSTSANEFGPASGGAWGGGRLTFGHGGGSGRLGPLILAPGEQLPLNTDSQAFPLAGQEYSIMSNLDPIDPDTLLGDYDPLDPQAWPTVTIDQFGQAFEFSEVNIGPAARIVLTGTRAARIFSRGELIHNGIIDLTGETPEAHVSNSGGDQANNVLDGQDTKDGGPGGGSGPAGGVGGQGADRMDMTGATLPVMINVGGILNPGAVNTGRPGGGVGGLPDGTGGKGGVHWPSVLPKINGGVGSDPNFGDGELSWIVADANKCRVAMVAGPGSGGSHALEGKNGLPISPYTSTFPGLLANTPAETPGGDNSALDLEAPGTVGPTAKRNLEFWRKHLRGGSGGGGGGLSLYASLHNGATGPSCSQAGGLFPFFDHSAAGGGGGGGAIMLVGGRRLALNGQVDCTGGGGGSATVSSAGIELCTQSGQIPGEAPNCEKYAAPGGGGAGGAVRLQAPIVELAGVAERIRVLGGIGGQGAGGSLGGNGSPGLVRIEYTGFVDQASDAALFGPLIAPYLPGDAGFNTPFTSAAILSIGEWADQIFRPESFSGSQSCWMEASTSQGTFFGLDFVADVAGTPDDLSILGWNMDVIYDHPVAGEVRFPYRGIPPVDGDSPDPDGYDETLFPAFELGGDDFQTFLGTTLNHAEPTLSTGSLFVVRFQGVRSSGTGLDLCNLDLAGPNVEPGSLTPWVDHPSKLNFFAPQPNIVRFAVIFDEQLADFDPIVMARVRGLSSLRIRVQPN